MTQHPAIRPGGDRPVTTPGEIVVALIDELEEIQELLEESGYADPGAPLLALIVARDVWWQDAFERLAATADFYRAEGRDAERAKTAAALRSRARTCAGAGNPFAGIGADWLNLAADIAEGTA